MASRDKETGPRRAEPEVASATGGHLSPGASGGSLFDPLNDPLPSETSAPGSEPPPASRAVPASSDPARTEVLGRTSGAAAVSRPAPQSRGAMKRRPGLRRVKRTVKHVDPFSVLKLSLFFYLCFLLVWLLIVAVLYSVISSAGFFDAVSSFCGSLELKSCRETITLGVVERWALVLGVMFAILGSLANVLFAITYNVAADLFGGIELTFVERDV